MKTIRLLFPETAGGGLETYSFGARLLEHLLPANDSQRVVRVRVAEPVGSEPSPSEGVFAADRVLCDLRAARAAIAEEQPDRIITIGGSCLVSFAPFDYLHGRHGKVGVVWIDAHPDVTRIGDGYPNAHSMVLGSMAGGGAPLLSDELENGPFEPEDILFVGLQPLHGYQERFLRDAGIPFRVQDRSLLSDGEIAAFARRYERLLVHFDIDALDERRFHSTYFANPELVGDGSGGGRMAIDDVARVIGILERESELVGLTISEYLPFDEERLHRMLSGIRLLAD